MSVDCINSEGHRGSLVAKEDHAPGGRLGMEEMSSDQMWYRLRPWVDVITAWKMSLSGLEATLTRL